jgi:ATP-dependent Lon protease
MDRITQIKTNGFRLPEKVIITNQYLLKNILKDIGMQENNILLCDAVIKWIIQTYTFEGGVRSLKQILYDILREINLRALYTKSKILPFDITKESLEGDILKKRQQIIYDKIHKKPMIGKINGLYATCNDMGGLVVIEARWVPSESKLGLVLTGRQGLVMKESMSVAKTLAWHLLDENDKNKLNEQWRNSGVYHGIHIHCPDGSTQKDGPSAGCAITTAMYSLLSGKKIKHDVALTGEIDLSGKVNAIGGLESKVFGAISAGAKIVLCPKGNRKDVDKIKESYPEIFINGFQLKTVSTIKHVFKEMFI